MARPKKRVCLEDGLKLDLNKIVRDGFGPNSNGRVAFRTQMVLRWAGPNRKRENAH